MSLRLKANLFFGLLILIFISIMMAREFDNTRRSVYEEIGAANRVATQVLKQVISVYQQADEQKFIEFLNQLGRVRANEIVFTNQQRELIYQSPPSPYKQGRFAPEWFANLTTPPVSAQTIDFPTGHITITPDPSRAILDGWEDMVSLAIMGLVSLLITNLIAFFLMSRWLSPFGKIRTAIEELEKGNHHIQLEKLHGKEAESIGQAFNRMVSSVNETIQIKEEKAKTEAELNLQQEFAHQLQTHIENERRDLARELHDELGQSLTAIRSIATSLSNQAQSKYPELQQTTNLLVEAAKQTYDGMHRLIPKLRPIALEQLGLEGALNDLTTELKSTHPQIQFITTIKISKQDDLSEIALFRIIQEAINNAIKHANPSLITIELVENDNGIRLVVENDGIPASLLSKAGHYGVIGMKERSDFLKGQIQFIPLHSGLRIELEIKK